MTRRSYSGNAPSTSLASAVTSIDTTMTLADGTNYPDAVNGPFVLTLDLGSASEEKVLVEARVGSNLSGVTRGFDGTTAASHASGARVIHSISKTDLDEANAHLNGTATHNSLTVTATNSGSVALTVKGVSGQLALLADWQTSTGTSLMSLSVNGTGQLTVGNGAIGSGSVSTGFVYVNNQGVQMGDRGVNAPAPSAGQGVLYVVGGVLRYTGSGGTVTTIAPA